MTGDLQVAEFLSNDVHKVIRMRCPGCRHNSRLEPLWTPSDQVMRLKDGRTVGVANRFCPDESCGQIIYVVYEITGNDFRVLLAAPRERVDFDTSGLPIGVLAALEEAAKCHAHGCYVAAAIMLRKTLEEVCADQQASGDNLRARIESLRTSVVLPAALLDGLDSLRLLGNDAAHIESKTFDQVGQEEVTLSFDIVKEVLKAVYQYGNLIGRLNALKKT